MIQFGGVGARCLTGVAVPQDVSVRIEASEFLLLAGSIVVRAHVAAREWGRHRRRRTRHAEVSPRATRSYPIRRWVVTATAALAALTLARPAVAAQSSLPVKQEELRRVQHQLDAQRQRLEQTRRREHRSSLEIQRLDRQRDATEQQLARLAAEQRRVQERTEAATADLARAEAALARRRSLLAARLVDINRYGRAGYLDVVLGATTFSEFVARTRLVGAIVQGDRQMIQAYVADRDRTAELRQLLNEQQAALRAVTQETQDRQRVLAQESAAKRAALEAIARERVAAQDAIRELEEDSAALEASIRQLQQQRGPGSARLAAFFWPLRGPVTSPFGFRIHPIFHRRLFHTGVDIAAAYGAPVRAAQDGVVLFAGWYGGYGKLVILDHGQGISTLYSHLSDILVAAREHVMRAEVIGRVGSTGYSTGPHLLYEVRVDGRPVDPQQYAGRPVGAKSR
jgi:murein DD-endopeptidase MepM/ murein hydrolase activator NlpD